VRPHYSVCKVYSGKDAKAMTATQPERQDGDGLSPLEVRIQEARYAVFRQLRSENPNMEWLRKEWRALEKLLDTPSSTNGAEGAGEAGARAIAKSQGYDPDDLAPIGVMCTGDNKPVPWWKVFEEQADACLAAAAPPKPAPDAMRTKFDCKNPAGKCLNYCGMAVCAPAPSPDGSPLKTLIDCAVDLANNYEPSGAITTEQLDQLQFGRSLHKRPLDGTGTRDSLIKEFANFPNRGGCGRHVAIVDWFLSRLSALSPATGATEPDATQEQRTAMMLARSATPPVVTEPVAQMLEYARRLNDIATTCEIDGMRGHASDLRRIAQQIVAATPVRGDREAIAEMLQRNGFTSRDGTVIHAGTFGVIDAIRAFIQSSAGEGEAITPDLAKAIKNLSDFADDLDHTERPAIGEYDVTKDIRLVCQAWIEVAAPLDAFVRAYEAQDATNFTDQMRDAYAMASTLSRQPHPSDQDRPT
jgi:hypothetical protein